MTIRTNTVASFVVLVIAVLSGCGGTGNSEEAAELEPFFEFREN